MGKELLVKMQSIRNLPSKKKSKKSLGSKEENEKTNEKGLHEIIPLLQSYNQGKLVQVKVPNQEFAYDLYICDE